MRNLREHSYTELPLLPAMLAVIGFCFFGCPKKAVPPVKEKKVKITRIIRKPAPAPLPSNKIVKLQPTKPVEAVIPVTQESDEPKRVPDLAFVVSRYEKVYFEYDKSQIQPEARQILQKNAEKIRDDLQQYPDLKLLVEGHCDERGANEYNLALGERRAFNVRDYLVSLGVSSNVLFTKSWGEEKPADSGHNESGWAKNRRAEFQVYTGNL